jgi:uncharacterized damage-inducible protein DinB
MRKKILQQILNKYPEARKTSGKYTAMARMAKQMYPVLADIPGRTLTDIVFHVVNADRDWRTLTEGENKEEKEILSQQKQIELGYTPGHYQNLKKLKTL